MSAIRETLPPFAADLLGPLLDAAGSELDLLESETQALCRRAAASTADGRGLTRWERELGLPARADLSTETRRAEVLAALDFFTVCTPDKIRRMLARLTGGSAALTEDFSAGAVRCAVTVADGIPADLRGVQTALRRAVPAHLDCALSAAAALSGSGGGARCLWGGMRLLIHN